MNEKTRWGKLNIIVWAVFIGLLIALISTYFELAAVNVERENLRRQLDELQRENKELTEQANNDAETMAYLWDETCLARNECSYYQRQYHEFKLMFGECAYWQPSDLLYITKVVIAESGNQSLKGQMAVAQCIYDRYQCSSLNSVVDMLNQRNQFAEPYSGDMSNYPAAFEAVMRVFIFGERVYDDDVIFFYNPITANASSVAAFEANHRYLGTIGDHVFRSW